MILVFYLLTFVTTFQHNSKPHLLLKLIHSEFLSSNPTWKHLSVSALGSALARLWLCPLGLGFLLVEQMCVGFCPCKLGLCPCGLGFVCGSTHQHWQLHCRCRVLLPTAAAAPVAANLQSAVAVQLQLGGQCIRLSSFDLGLCPWGLSNSLADSGCALCGNSHKASR